MKSSILGRTIAFHPIFVDLTGSVAAALLLSQAVYWQQHTSRQDGWWWKTAAEWQQETGLSRHEQGAARRLLRRHPWWAEDRRGVPAKTWFSLDLDLLLEALSQISLEKPQFAGKRQSRLPDSSNQDARKTASKFAEDRQTNTKNTAKNTAKNTTTLAAAGEGQGGGQMPDFILLDSELAARAGDDLARAGLPPGTMQQVLDELAGQVQAGRALYPSKLLASLLDAAREGRLDQSSFGKAARRRRLALRAGARGQEELALRTAARQAELADVPKKYLADQRVMRLLALGKTAERLDAA